MAKCNRCGKWSLFLKVNRYGYCSDCAAAIAEQERRIQEEKDRKEDARRKWESSPEFYLSKICTRAFSPKSFIDDMTAVYVYRAVPLMNVDRAMLKNMVQRNKFTLHAKIEDGAAVLYWDNARIGTVNQDTITRMLVTWIEQELPVVINIMCVTPGRETCGIAFYRSEIAYQKNRSKTIVRLTGCTSNERQLNIACCTSGEKLICVEDDEHEGRVNVVTLVDEAPVGNLPARYAAEFLDGCGSNLVLFDHRETNDNGSLVPFVAIYE